MDDARFDALVRAFAGGPSRRGLLGALLVAAASPLAAEAGRTRPRAARDDDDANDRRREGGARMGGPGDAACLGVGERCGKRPPRKGRKGGNRRASVPCTKCCSNHSITQHNGAKRCACKPAGAPATNPAQCCSGRRSAGGFCGACDPGLTECVGGCVDLETDDANCGACGHACESGQRCLAGGCTCDATSCPEGCCDDGGACRPGSSADACGTGGAACARCIGPDTCGGGNPGTPKTCGCTPDANACAGKNCGSVTDPCGFEHRCGPDACDDGYFCTDNACACPDGNAVCDGDCCAPGEVCRNGSGECCTPQGKAAACAGRECGTVVDICTGATYDCAPDAPPCTERGFTCSGAGQCQCPGGRAICPPSGGSRTCCVAGQVCASGNGACCTPTTCAAQGKTCGTMSDGCGGMLDCGSCAAGSPSPFCIDNVCVPCTVETDGLACQSGSSHGQCCAGACSCFAGPCKRSPSGGVCCCTNPNQVCVDVGSSTSCQLPPP